MNELSLEIRENKPGILTTNAQEILDRVKEMLPRYKAENYSEANLDEARADKATLNKLKKALNDERIRLEREYMAPFQTFKTIINEACEKIADGVAAIDEVVKAVDLKAKAERQKMIDDLWAKLDWNTLPLAAIQRPEWMNKDVSKKKIATEMQVIISDIDSNVALLKQNAHPDDLEAVRLRYFETLDFKNALQFATRLKAIRSEAETAEQAAKDAPSPTPPPEVFVKPAISIPLQRVLKVEGTKEQLMGLAAYMKDNGIKFWRVEDERLSEKAPV